MSNELTLNQVLAAPNNDPLWVLNTTSESEVGQAGELLIPVPKRHGVGTDIVVVPMTWLPHDLTSEAERELIVNSSEFRKALYNRHLTVIDQASADNLLGDSDARAEQKRMSDRKKQVSIAVAESMSGSKKDREGPSTNQNTRDPNLKPDEAAPGITHQYATWVNRMVLLEDGAVNSEIRLRRTFTFKELRYALSKLGNKALTAARINQLIAEKKAKKAGKAGR